MESANGLSKERRKQIFHQELYALWKKGHISKSDFIGISASHDRYYEQGKRLAEEAARLVSKDSAGDPAVRPAVQVPPRLSDFREEGAKKQSAEAETAKSPESPAAAAVRPQSVPDGPKKTADQIRERNITAILVVGVILLMFGGLILATAQWGSLNALLKVISISMVSVVFAGMSYVSYKMKIRQTSFAFLTLAAFFVPVAILSAAFYQIFGHYLSFEGGGSSLLGLAGGAVCLVIYYYIAKYFQSKLFIFVSLVTFAVTVFFGLKWLTPFNDLLFLLMTVFNLLLLWNADRLKKTGRLALFRPYLFRFIQFKVMAEGFVIFTLYEDTVFYSLTLMLTGVLFLMMEVRFSQKYYHFAFTAIFTYGWLHLIANSLSGWAVSPAIALLPLIYTALFGWLGRKNKLLYKSFLNTSLTAGILAFLYILGESIDDYGEMALALLLLCIQYVYLVRETNNKMYTFAAFFLFEAVIWNGLLAAGIAVSPAADCLFAIQAVLFAGLYLGNRKGQLVIFRDSALIFTGLTALAAILWKSGETEWLAVSLYFLAVCILFLAAARILKGKTARVTGLVGAPAALAMSFCVLYAYLSGTFSPYAQDIGLSVHLLGAAFLVIGAGYGLGRVLDKGYFASFYLTGQALGMISFLVIYSNSYEALSVTVIMLIITALNACSVHLFRHHLLWSPLVLTSLGVYFSLMGLFQFEAADSAAGFYTLAPLFFMAVSEGLARFDRMGRRYFFWASHVIALPIAAAVTIFALLGEVSSFWFLAFPVLYAFSGWRSTRKWQRYVFAYAGFSSVLVQVWLFMQEADVFYGLTFTFAVTALLLTVFWAGAGGDWKKIAALYLTPFMHVSVLLGIAEAFSLGYPGAVPSAVWAACILVQLVWAWYLVMKQGWVQAVPVSLLLALLFVYKYTAVLDFPAAACFLLVFVSVMLLLSWRYFDRLAVTEENKVSIDYYRITGFLFLMQFLFLVDGTEVQAAAKVSGAALLPVYAAVLRYLTNERKERNIYGAAAVALCLYPYSVLMDHIDVPAVWQAEAAVLPLLVIATILLRVFTDGGRTVRILEAAGVAIGFIILIADAIFGGTVQDAVILGSLSIAAALFGFIMRYKSYFLSGTAAILFNVYWNTKPMWGSMPWWFYLIVGGLLLIGAASFIEWKKQKDNRSSKEILVNNKEKVKRWFAGWM